MTVYAVTPIQHGEDDGTVTHIEVGATLDEATFGEDVLREMVVNGSAVEVGKTRKYSETPVGPPVDEATQKRDELLAKAGQPVTPGPSAVPNTPPSEEVPNPASR